MKNYYLTGVLFVVALCCATTSEAKQPSSDKKAENRLEYLDAQIVTRKLQRND